jgi:protein SCO1/2
MKNARPHSLLGIAPMLLALMMSAAQASTPVLPVQDEVGGPFQAQSSLGRVVESKEFHGKVVMLFFGYTSCQDICPATMAHLAAVMRALGPASDDVQVLLSTIDPENDTEAHLKAYLERFDPRFVGLTGSQSEMNGIASKFIVKHDRSHGVKVTTDHNRTKPYVDEAFLYAHSQQVYLIDKLGRTRGFVYIGNGVDDIADKARSLLAE